MRRVAIHISVNTCSFALVTESMWSQLIRNLKHVFPEAAVLVSSIVPPMERLKKTFRYPTQRSWQSAAGRRCQLLTTPTPSLPGAVRQGSTCTETKCIPATVARTGWCSTSSLLLVPAVTRLAPSPAKLPPWTQTRPSTAPAATGRNQATPCSQTFAAGTCTGRF